ncbi:unnamed protein product [Rotaria magnacalcarata]|uniref:Superoxide dismutase copper/zinc binding domain-containing protein n=2 Tax=Rotaria magnacalcarata TaxID=392030 RepID=A0A815QN32_9BILA|nr:unnamed protein product [Rotaria magnacalcarata]CAF2051290.1 unnamed protein product [Rotaria magnacalcarata]CAF2077705.1 unnamed protein product [Rotaria magnacalcarata]CAF2173530.1 unnamed protein product [Rotaria magnacalcarata]
MIVLIVSVLFLTIHQGQCAMQATATLYADNTNASAGILTFRQDNAGTSVRISGSLSGLNITSAHGFHVHEFGVSETVPNCTAAGGHFNPFKTLHGPRTANITGRHVGDLGNITTDDKGNVNINIEDSIIQLYNGNQSIVNLTIVVHRMRDDGGQGLAPTSNTTGDAGARVLCGRILLSDALIIKPAMLIYHVAIMTAILMFY